MARPQISPVFSDSIPPSDPLLGNIARGQSNNSGIRFPGLARPERPGLLSQTGTARPKVEFTCPNPVPYQASLAGSCQVMPERTYILPMKYCIHRHGNSLYQAMFVLILPNFPGRRAREAERQREDSASSPSPRHGPQLPAGAC